MILEIDYQIIDRNLIPIIVNHKDYNTIEDFLDSSEFKSSEFVIDFCDHLVQVGHWRNGVFKEIDYIERGIGFENPICIAHIYKKNPPWSTKSNKCILDTKNFEKMKNSRLSTKYPFLIQFIQSWERDYKLSSIL